MKKYILYIFTIIAVVTFSGCSLLGGNNSINSGGIRMSINSGINWEVKNKVDDKQNISSAEILSITVDPLDTNKIYLGTKNKGILISENSAESWEKFNFPTNKNVYGVLLDYFNPGVIYATGTINKRGKILKSYDGGDNWEEIYTEPRDDTYVSAMAMDKNNPQNIFIGTNKGVILRTSDGGASWVNLYHSEKNNAIAKIDFSEDDRGTMYYIVFKGEVLISDKDGNDFRKAGESEENQQKIATPFSIEADKNTNGVLYIGTGEGLIKSSDYGETFEEINIIASSKKIPIGSISVKPFSSNEIIYSAAQAIYRSGDGGKKWSTAQLNTDKVVSIIEFNVNKSNIVFAGLRSFK